MLDKNGNHNHTPVSTHNPQVGGNSHTAQTGQTQTFSPLLIYPSAGGNLRLKGCYSSYIETTQKPTSSPSFDNYFMEHGNVLSNVAFFDDLMPKSALSSLLEVKLIAPSFTLHEGF